METVSHQHTAEEAFDLAITQGRLSINEAADNFAGKYMFMGCEAGEDLFKNIMTRRYDV